MKGFRFDISSFFQNNASNNLFGSINLSDYASIRNGSYGKLMKSYYAEQKKGTVDNSSVTGRTDKKEPVDTTGLSVMKQKADGLKDAAEALNKVELWKQTDGSYDMDRIVSAVKDFAKEYKRVIDQSAKVNSQEISRDTRYMTSLTGTMSKSLGKVGITVGFDGKLSINEDALKQANGSSLKTLFSGAVSYGTQIAGKAGEISRDAVMNSSLYGSNGTLQNMLSGNYNKWI